MKHSMLALAYGNAGAFIKPPVASLPPRMDKVIGNVGGYISRKGWTNRRYQRAMMKKRNQKRNRGHH